MSTKEQSVTLLRKNKQAQVEALNTCGFGLNENARAADFPMYVKWGAGLLDVTLAAVRISDHKNFYFSVSEWQSLSATEQSLFLRRGIRVRAMGLSFILAAESLPAVAWGGKATVTDATDTYYNGKTMSYNNAVKETGLILAYYNGKSIDGVVGAPAAEAAVAYKAFTEENDGLEDTTNWILPCGTHLLAVYRYKNEIDEVFVGTYGSEFKMDKTNYWTCLQYSSDNSFYVNLSNGSLYYATKTNTNKVRPISIE